MVSCLAQLHIECDFLAVSVLFPFSFISIGFSSPTYPSPSLSFFVCHFWGRVLPSTGWPWTWCESLFCTVITGVCTCSSSFFCTCDKTHWPKALLRKVRARTWARAIARHWGLAYSLSCDQQYSASSLTQSNRPQWAGPACINWQSR